MHFVPRLEKVLGDSLLRTILTFDRLHFFLHLLDLDALTLDVEPQASKNAHINVGHPDEREPGDEISAPAVKQQLISGQPDERRGDVMTEAVFAGKQVEEFSLQ
jgi:hypothetical protein